MQDFVEPLHKLADIFGASGALAIAAWWYERRVNHELQRRLMRMAAAQLHAAREIRSQMDTLKEELIRAIYERS